ncbi:MAG: hypothetical protein AAGA68_00205 [Pseudomonadota bacterium]
MTASTLYIEDGRFDRLVFATHFKAMRRDDLTLDCVDSVESAVHAIQACMPAIVFLDNRVPPYDSFEESLAVLVDAGFAGPVVLVTGLPTDEMQQAVDGVGPVCALLDKIQLTSRRLTEVITPLLARLPNG